MIPVISSNKTEFEFFADSFGSEFTLEAVRDSVLPVTFDPTTSLKIRNVFSYLIPFQRKEIIFEGTHLVMK
jgi:hypothetical protein